MQKKQCGNCAYYVQHYGLGDNQLFRRHCGHCRRGNMKRKLPDTQACLDFQQGKPDENEFATREYLSKALLEYMMSLDFLPEIQDPCAYEGMGRTEGVR